jgi:hypothetical protein
MKNCLTILAFVILKPSLLATGNFGRDFRGVGSHSASISIDFAKLSAESLVQTGSESGFNLGLGGNLSIIDEPDLFGFDIKADYDHTKIKEFK